MTEREPTEPPYWTIDEAIGEVHFWGEPWALRLAVHLSEERYSGLRQEIVPLRTVRGRRTYVHARPYLLVPDLTLGIRFSDQPQQGGFVGAVRESRWDGMRHEDVGKAQAWAYPADRLVVLFECFFEERYQSGAAAEDPNLRRLWQAFAGFLVGWFPETEQLVTPADDPLYEREDYQRFLAGLGYVRLNERAFARSR
ncbi:MAG TPA: hypothetical protein VKQ30_07670 [Ktedonobacterales bacterium]|nr:hypothetical protein [Ktedonobacterales bacterium]